MPLDAAIAGKLATVSTGTITTVLLWLVWVGFKVGMAGLGMLFGGKG